MYADKIPPYSSKRLQYLEISLGRWPKKGDGARESSNGFEDLSQHIASLAP